MTDIDEIKSRLNIVDIIGTKVTLKKAGRNFKGLCPFHNEKTPSFMVSPERQMFHCFGCQKGGSVIDFVMEYEHVDFLEALEELAEKAGVKLVRREGETPEARLKQKLYEVNHLASEYYHFLLTKHSLGVNALAYLKHRGVTDKSINTFFLGYSPNGWEGLYKFLRKKGYDDRLMEQAGLVLRGHGRSPYYDRFRGRVMFTLKDHRGNVVGFSGRFLDPNAKEAKYINTSETPIYTKSNVLYGLDVTKDMIAKSQEAIVMEGELDVISSFQEGVSNVVAIKGSALTAGHVNLLRRWCERILFALDSDVAGDAASRRGIEIADQAGFDMKVVILPAGKDPDELARQDPILLKNAVKEAIPIYDYFFSSSFSRNDGKTAFGKKKIAEELLPILVKIENPIVQAHYVKKLAERLGVTETTILEALKKTKTEQSFGLSRIRDTTPEAPKVYSREEKLELYLMALLFQGKTAELFEDLKEQVKLADFVLPPVRRILNALETFLAKNRIFLVKDFVDALPRELLPTFDEALLWDVSRLLESEEVFVKEWGQACREFLKLLYRRRISDLTKTVPTEDEGSEEATAKLQADLKTATGDLARLEKSG